jgi:hypothetical protein
MEARLWARHHPLASTVKARATGQETVPTRTEKVCSPGYFYYAPYELHVSSWKSFNRYAQELLIKGEYFDAWDLKLTWLACLQDVSSCLKCVSTLSGFLAKEDIASLAHPCCTALFAYHERLPTMLSCSGQQLQWGRLQPRRIWGEQDGRPRGRDADVLANQRVSWPNIWRCHWVRCGICVFVYVPETFIDHSVTNVRNGQWSSSSGLHRNRAGQGRVPGYRGP